MKTLKILVSMIIMLIFIGQNEVSGQWGTNGTHIYNTNTGNVGIGTNSPAKLLYVGKNMTEPTITVRNFGGAGGASFQMLDDNSGADWKFKAINSGGFKIRDNANGMDVMTFEPGSAANVMYIKSGGSLGIGTATPDSTAVVDMSSTTRGFLLPRMTAVQRTAITAPATGLLIFQTDAAAGYYYYNGSGWILLGGAEGGGGHMIDADGNAYPTVMIGGQEWMAQNLMVTHYRNGDAIPNVTDNAAWAALTTGAYCWYNNNQGTYGKFGMLYNWHAVNDPRQLCPEDWHVATNSDRVALEAYLGGNTVAGAKMKAAINFNAPNTGATNESGFSGFAGGFRYSAFNNNGVAGYYWTSTQSDPIRSWGFILSAGNADLGSTGFEFAHGFSVRCLRD